MIASGYYGTLQDLASRQIRVVIAGMPRSAGTWAWQIARALAGDGVVKTHDVCRLAVSVILTVRDPPEAMTSHIRAVESSPTPWSREIAEPWVGQAHKWTQDWLETLADCARRNTRSLVLRYEQVILDPAEAAEKIARFLDLQPSAEQLAQALSDSSLEANRRRAATLPGFSAWEQTTLIHGRHITYNGRPWYDHYDRPTVEYISQALGVDRRRLGYGRRDSDVEVREDGPLG